MKIKGFMFIANGGDGSAVVEFFRTQAGAQKAADDELEKYVWSFCDNVERFEFDVDENGLIIDSQ